MARFIKIEVQCGDEIYFHEVLPRWKGKNLAVHAPMVNGEIERSDYWIITHLGSGKKAGIMYSVKRAIKLAREWDELFDTMDAKSPHEWVMVEEWRAALD
jgi:hypothetical protein